ncbi:hypothetical protein [Myxococcus landrumensis]|uniref:Lipoprotein n=1 Tax=Myxococcus landrumensis TaxID=2813577 RepID=A0ABX7NDZ1_9BACT|nr:hypothetical protein [Myxococcus landrumus]QSQ17025.1 hypothetical protein JY572_13630 [Myxococcus landrumus]
MRVTVLGLVFLAVGCGENSPEPAAEPPPSTHEASLEESMPSEAELAATRTAAGVTAVPVNYVIDPSTTMELTVTSGEEQAEPAASPLSPETPGAVRRPLK